MVGEKKSPTLAALDLEILLLADRIPNARGIPLPVNVNSFCSHGYTGYSNKVEVRSFKSLHNKELNRFLLEILHM